MPLLLAEQGTFTPSDVCYAEGNINALELLAIKYDLQSFASIIKNRHIFVRCDNSAAVSYISNMGGTHSRLCNAIAKEIWLWTMTQGVWVLDPSTFELITKKLG